MRDLQGFISEDYHGFIGRDQSTADLIGTGVEDRDNGFGEGLNDGFGEGMTSGDWITGSTTADWISLGGREVIGGLISDKDTMVDTAVGEGISLATETIVDNGFGEGITGVEDILKNDAFNVGG